MTKQQWKELLEDWDRIAMAGIRRKRKSKDPLCELSDEETDALEMGTSFSAPAKPVAIKSCEAQLGIVLPPSVKTFYALTDGWPSLDLSLPVLACSEVHRFGASTIFESMRTIEKRLGPRKKVQDSDYAEYGAKQNPLHWRFEYLEASLSLSDDERDPDSAILLNPSVTTSTGEWEAWVLHVRDGAAHRFQSFFDLMARLRDQAEESYALVD